MRRYLALLVLAALLAPGTWWRTRLPDRLSEAVTITALPHSAREQAGLAVTGLWQLDAPGEGFGGYSSLLLLGQRGIRLYSDRGFVLTIPRPGAPAGHALPVAAGEVVVRALPRQGSFDIESATRSPATGQVWLGYENHHAIVRFDASGRVEGLVRPPQARHWADNGGMESLVRLADGRFIGLREDAGDLLVYAGDPVAGMTPQTGKVAWPQGYSPTDATQLPDGRLLVVLRRLAWHLPVFDCRLVLVDLAGWQPGTVLRPQPLVQLEDLLPRDNWEAVAAEPGPQGTVSLWLATDDNRSALQRSLLAHVRFTPPPPITPRRP